MAAILERNRSKAPIGYADYRLIARDGRVVWVRDDEVIVGGENGAEPVSQGYMQDVTSRRRDSMRLELLVGILGLAAEERTPEEIVGEAARMLASAVGDVNVTFVAIEPGPTLHARYSTEHNGPIPDTLAIPGYIERLERGPIVVADVTERRWLAGVQDELHRHRIGSAVDVPLRRDGQHRRRPLVQHTGAAQLGRPRGDRALRGRRATRDRARQRRGERGAPPRGARPPQPRRDPRGGQPCGRALPQAAAARRRDGRPDASPRRGDRGEPRLRVRERRRRRRRAVRAAPCRLVDRRHADDRRPASGAPTAGAALPALGEPACRGRAAERSRARAARR